MIQNTFSWYNGEIFEGKFILAFGIFLILAALAFNYFGNLPSAKALLWPLLVIGAIFTTIGIGGVYSNSKKIARIENEYKQDREKFIKREIKRIEDFQYLYPMSIAISLGCFLIALTVLYFTKNIYFHAIAMALILFGMAFAVIDYFSKERASIYYEKLKG